MPETAPALKELKWDSDGLVTVVAQDRLTGELRMVAHANRAALAATLETGQAHFYSRSRQTLWRKGESSGNTLAVAEVWADCDGDAVLYLLDPNGPSCHTGRQNCFFRRLDLATPAAPDEAVAQPLLAALWTELAARRKAPDGTSYTQRLLAGGSDAIGAKLREEADELARALATESPARAAAEAADLLYHMLVGLLLRDVCPSDMLGVLQARRGVSGLAEKAARGTTK